MDNLQRINNLLNQTARNLLVKKQKKKKLVGQVLCRKCRGYEYPEFLKVIYIKNKDGFQKLYEHYNCKKDI